MYKRERSKEQVKKENVGSVRKKLLVMVTSIGILALAKTGLGALKVQAAEPPVISDLKVAKSGDEQGIVAQCSYQNYHDQSGYEMTLYLYRKEESGQMSILMRQKLPYAAVGNTSTGSYQAQEGVYFASVETRHGIEIMQTYSENYYKVKIKDGKVEVTEISEAPEDTSSGNRNKESGSDKEKAKAPSCQHNLEYEMERQATVDQDSLLAYQCTICGAVIDYKEVPNSAYSVFLNEAAQKIKNARESEVLIDTNRWMSFNRTVLEALESRRDVTVNLHYQYQGQRYSVKIPAGEDVSGLADENGYCGFLCLTQRFGEEGLAGE